MLGTDGTTQAKGNFYDGIKQIRPMVFEGVAGHIFRSLHIEMNVAIAQMAKRYAACPGNNLKDYGFCTGNKRRHLCNRHRGVA